MRITATADNRCMIDKYGTENVRRKLHIFQHTIVYFRKVELDFDFLTYTNSTYNNIFVYSIQQLSHNALSLEDITKKMACVINHNHSKDFRNSSKNYNLTPMLLHWRLILSHQVKVLNC